jgi:hypothetical protein
MLSYILFSGIFIGGFITIREYENNHRMTLFDLFFNFIGGMLLGWLMFPIVAIAYLGQIKLKR